MSFLLTGIWSLSWGLAAASLIMMLTLVVRRVITDAAQRRLMLRRSKLEDLFIRALSEPTILQGLTFDRTDKLLLGDIAADLSKSVRSDEQAALIAVLDGIEVDRVYADAVLSGDIEERLEAVRGLSIFNNKLTFDVLWQALKDEVLEVRLAAAYILVRSTRSFSVGAFLDALDVGTKVQTRSLRPIMIELARRDAAGVVEALGATENLPRRRYLAFALGRSGDYSVVPELILHADDPDVDLRAEVIRALGTLQHPAAADAVLAALSDPAWEVRAQAAQAVADIGLPEAQSHLESLLEDSQWWVRYRSGLALWRLGGEARERLRACRVNPGRIGRIADLVLTEMEGQAA